MAGTGAARRAAVEHGTRSLFAEVGAFLAEHRLSADPANYSFAYHVLENPTGPIAQAVSRLTDGGFRLSGQDIETLGGAVAPGMPVAASRDAACKMLPADTKTSEAVTVEALMARTQFQVDGLADTMRAMHAETRGFGRDLAASTAAIARAGTMGIEEVVRLAGDMIARIHLAETRLANATTEATRLREALDEARGSARSDPLTELINRRGFAEAFAALVPGAATTIALCDIDHFKQVNDRFGHAVGDRVLKAIAQTLAAECAGHVVARHGGEEFAILIDGLAPTAAAAMLDGVRTTIAAKRFRLRDTEAPIGVVTISIGVATAHQGEPLDATLDRADAALYAAKHEGRNRVCVAPDIGV